MVTRRPALAFIDSLYIMYGLMQHPSAYLVMERHLSAARLAPYVLATNGSRRGALQLYHWNLHLSGAVYEALHMFEVVVRNAIDTRLRDWNATQVDATGRTHSREWLLDPSRLLQRIVGRDDIDRATTRARRAIRSKHRLPLHADVLTQLSFGTWRFLLPDKDPGRKLLWNDAICSAFPHLSEPAGTVTQSVATINILRNRVAHLEPLLNSGTVRIQFNRMRSVLSAVDPEAEHWFVSRQRVTAALKSRPVFR